MLRFVIPKLQRSLFFHVLRVQTELGCSFFKFKINFIKTSIRYLVNYSRIIKKSRRFPRKSALKKDRLQITNNVALKYKCTRTNFQLYIPEL